MRKKILTRTELQGYGEAERCLVFVYAFAASVYDVAFLRQCLNVVLTSKLSIADVHASAERLVRIGVLSCVRAHAASAISRNCYERACLFEAAALSELLQDSVRNDWWPIFEINSNTGEVLRRSTNYWSYRLSEHKEDALWMRAFINASGLRVDLATSCYLREKCWEASLRMVHVLAEGECLPCGDFGVSNPITLHLAFLSMQFIRGCNIRPTLTELGEKMATGVLQPAGSDLCEIVALSVLTGISFDAKMVQAWKIADSAKAFATIGDKLRTGDFAAANKLCQTAFKELSDLKGLAAPGFQILSMLVNAFYKPSDSRLAQLCRAVCPAENYRRYDRGYGEQALVEERNAWLEWLVCLQIGYLETSETAIYAQHFVGNLGLPIWLLANGMKRDSAIDYAAKLIASAEKAQTNGYPTLAGVYLSTFGWAFAADAREKLARLAEEITASGGVWFKPYDGTLTEWKRLVSVFDDRLPKTMAKKPSNSSAVKTGQLVWTLAISHYGWNSENPNLCCYRIIPYFRGPRAAEDGSGDKVIALASVYSGKYDACLSETDKTVIAALQGVGYNGPHGSASVPIPALEALCGHANVASYRGEGSTKNVSPEATTLVRKDVAVVGASAVDGAMKLSVPTWFLEADQPYVLRQTDENAYALYVFSRESRNVLGIFREFGEKGCITLPAEAVKAMRPIFGRLAAVMPLQGTLSDVVGEASGIARVEGDATPLVRLALDGANLHISLRSRPLAQAAEILLEPGVGQAERTLSLAKGPVVLVRNLAQEKKNAAVVIEALEPFQSWQERPLEWQIEDTVGALEALSAIQSIGSKAQVEWLPGKKISVMHPSKCLTLSAHAGIDRWFAVTGEWALDDGRVLSLVQLLDLLDRRVGTFVPIDDKGYVALNRALLRQLEALKAAGQVQAKTLRVPTAAVPMLDGVFAGDEKDTLHLPEAIAKTAEEIRRVFAEEPRTPKTLAAVLRSYQQEGFLWLSRLAKCGFGACLADDMGLGKTVQVIALLLERAKEGASLVVAPSSVCGNWRRELQRFAPTLHPVMALEEGVDIAQAKAQEVVIVSYGYLLFHEEDFVAKAWNGVVLDEAQAIKNDASKRARLVKRLPAKFRVAATGTPVENRLGELWSLFDFLNPGLLGPAASFMHRFAPDGRASADLKRLVKPLILRRLKGDVLEDLPEKTEITIPVELGHAERSAYEACRRHALETLGAQEGGATNRISILAELTRLRRFCCHPSLVLGTNDVPSAKLEALLGILDGLQAGGHRALVFSQFTDYLAIVRKAMEARDWSCCYLDGATPTLERERLVNAFQGGEGDFFLISLKAGGTGLNLTAADYVILLDPWWNPAVENQAADRVHRIGQKNPVTVYRLIASDTVEERVLELHREKKVIAEDVLDGTGHSALTPEALMRLFG